MQRKDIEKKNKIGVAYQKKKKKKKKTEQHDSVGKRESNLRALLKKRVMRGDTLPVRQLVSWR